MQRPRRTSELHEEPETATKRQSRIPSGRFTYSVGVTPLNAIKHGTRQTTSVTGSASRGRTPMKTPQSSARALFSAEKKRNAAGISLHNDKKWIQDQTHRIGEYLKNAFFNGQLNGLTEEFFMRSSFLKQMSIKQFVYIINHFLKFVSGNRFTVGNNHVEDIFNILQKLNYPYAVNKSWLKTPTTMNAFGNVIVLFDFFMNFVSVFDNKFELEDLQDCTTENELEMEPDLEFKSTLIENCYQSFNLWDRQLNDELENMKRSLADLLLKKRGFEGLNSVEQELETYEITYKEIQNTRPHIDPNDENKYENLRAHVKAARKELDQLIENYDLISKNLIAMQQKKKHFSDKCAVFEKENAKIQANIEKQTCNVKERDTYVEKIKLLRVEIESNARTMRDLQTRDHNKKIELSFIKKKVTDEIEHINNALRDLTDILCITDNQDKLQISLSADSEDIERLASQLKYLLGKLEPKLFEVKEQLQKYENEIKEQFYIKTTTLEPDYNLKNEKLTKLLESMEIFEQRSIEASKVTFTKIQELDDQLKKYEIEIEELGIELEEKKIMLQQLEQKNEEIMFKTEEAHKIRIAERKAYLKEFATNLNECVSELDKLNRLVFENKEEKL